MNRRVLAAALAGALALFAFIAMFSWGSSAESRAMAGVKTTSVYTVVAPVAKGTLGSALGQTVKLSQFPAVAIPAGAVTNLSQIATKIASADLIPGEVLLVARFIDKTKAAAGTVEVPKGMEQISLVVKPEQVRGGSVAAGDHIAIISTVDSTTAPGPSTSGVTVGSKAVTQQVMSHLLVTAVQGGTAAAAPAGGAGGTLPTKSTVATGSVMITVAVSVGDAEKVVWILSQTKIYLAVETVDTDASTSKIATGAEVFNK